MDDNELKDILISIQKGIINLQNQISEVDQRVSQVDKKVENVKLTLENETNKKIDALFDSRVDEIRHRKENIETNAKVADLEVRVDNLEKAFKAS